MKDLTKLFFTASALLFFACSQEREKHLFEEIPAEKTHITFANMVKENQDNNVLVYPYYFNGGGIAVGDLNNDGLPDVYFSGNQVANKLYLNKGDLRFEEITGKAGLAVANGWKTGVTMADVNQDGWIDIYVCRSAMSDPSLRRNLLFINNHDLTFTESAKLYGIDDNSYSTHAAFFDYDLDGDLDLFLLNHSLPQYAGFSNLLVSRKKEKGNEFGSKLFQNNGGKFTDVSEKSGIINNVLSFGLGLAISDINFDGWPDLYISNDFNEEDYLYFNNHDGTFTNVIRKATGHVSLFSMGSDIADVNNDGLADIFTLDMLPETNERIKLSSGDDNYDKYKLLIDAGFHHQSMRNMLQLNNGDGTFSEIGQLAGISNTDWSWASLFADFDGDGWKDLFVSNGYEKDYTNMQFLKFTVDQQLKARRVGGQADMGLILDKIPSIEVGNYLFRNNGNLTFTKKNSEWGITRTFKSNGAAYADMDNDGDHDLLINAMNEPAVFYKNNSVEENGASFLTVDLAKNNPRVNIIGTKVLVYRNDALQIMEFFPSRGFQSCMHDAMKIGMNGSGKADSIRIIWPDNKTEVFCDVTVENVFAPTYKKDNAVFSYTKTEKPLFHTSETIEWNQMPPDINDFKRQFMLPRMYSFSGPRMAKADVNGDGLADVFICGPRSQSGALFLQSSDGVFIAKNAAAFDRDREHQDEDAVFFDFDGDRDMDLYVVSGGYSFKANDPLLQDRLYVNDGSGNFERVNDALPAESLAGSCVAVLDVNGDTHMDLFVGSRLIPGQYPVSPRSILLVNNGKGQFGDEIKTSGPSLEDAGMICDATVADLNDDGKDDLIVVGEWTPVNIFISDGTKLVDQTAEWHPGSTNGLWNCVIDDDFDGDGDVDIIVGNYGLNSQYNVSPEEPATLVYKDFNSDGQVDAFFNYYINGRSYPFASRDEALGQVTTLKSKYPDYVSYSNATLETIFSEDELEDAVTLRADMLQTVYLENNAGKFTMRDLPVQAQYAPVHALVSVDVDRDGDLDFIAAGNESHVRVRIGRSDANKGFVFLNDGKGHFTYMPQDESGLSFTGDIRDLIIINSNNGSHLIAGQIQGELESYSLTQK